MANKGKRYRNIADKAPQEILEPEKALEFLKTNASAKFDETVELGLHMGIDPKKSENAVRGSVSLPNGTGKKVSVLVFATGAAADAATEAGADVVGGDELIEKVKGGWTEFDVAIATTDAMKEVRKLGRVLGPRGLMPNPKTGTVTDDTATAVKLAKAGKVDFRMDRHGNVSVPLGKASFGTPALLENLQAVMAAVRAEKPAGAKGVFIKNSTLSTTMGAGIRVNLRD